MKNIKKYKEFTNEGYFGSSEELWSVKTAKEFLHLLGASDISFLDDKHTVGEVIDSDYGDFEFQLSKTKEQLILKFENSKMGAIANRSLSQSLQDPYVFFMSPQECESCVYVEFK